MLFEYKPDFEDARQHWEAFWKGEIIDRPCIRIQAPKNGCKIDHYPYPLQEPNGCFADYATAFDNIAKNIYYGGDAIPFFTPNLGPDIYSAFLGAELEYAIEDCTSWAKPFIKDWKTDASSLSKPHGFLWNAALDYASKAAEIAEGRFGLGVLDLHSNLDCLAAIRGPQNLCMDLLDCPDDVEDALKIIRNTYTQIHNGLYEAAGMNKTGTSSWLPYYSEKKFAVVQCDFICMISPDLARRFLYPALEEEVGFLDHCCYHYDGPDALIHLDDILAMEKIHSIQWVPGAGNPPVIEWMDLLKKIQSAGKGLYIGGSIDEIRIFHKELRPEKIMYDTWAASQAEADKFLDWLVVNT